MINHPGKPITIYDVAEIAGEAYGISFIPRNIVKGFETSGICPFNRDIFSEKDLLCSFVTDRPAVAEESRSEVTPEALQDVAIGLSCDQPGLETQCTPKKQCLQQSTDAPESPTPIKVKNITPESIRPFGKAEPRKKVQRGRKPGRTRILTDTPEKNIILEEALLKADKKKKIDEKFLKKGKKMKPQVISPVQDSQPGPSSIRILQDQNLTLIMCSKCKKYSQNRKQMLKCTFCHQSYHNKCVPTSHKNLFDFDSDDESDQFVCVACYVVTNDSDDDSQNNDEIDVQTLFHECRQVYK